jgi:hypothetical protein
MQNSFKIGGSEHKRMAYGEEKTDWGADRQPCHHCRVVKGELHKIGCFIERCPVCGEQAMTCACPYEDGLPRRPISASRQLFYKLFYLAIVPAAILICVKAFGWRSMPVYAIWGMPALLTAVFWRMMGPMELSQVISVPPPEAEE